MIFFTKHAREKFSVLERHGFKVTETQVIHALTIPEVLDYSRTPLIIAQRQIDRMHVLRVVFRKEGDIRIIITFYPGRKSDYGKKAK